MKLSLSTARFAAILAVTAVVFGAGLVSGAAGQPLIMGSTTNSAGSSATKMSSNVNGNAFAVAQTGSGNAANGIRGDASQGTGGVFTSSSNNALFATAASGNRFAIVAVGNGSAGTGGALLADGNANTAIEAVSDSGTGIEATSGTCTGLLCGRTGVVGEGFGFAGGVSGEGPLGVVGIDSTGGSGFGFITGGDASIGGDLSVGSCTGCSPAQLASNGGSIALTEGDAVTATGVTTDAEGNLFVVVQKAGEGDTVFGIVSAGVKGVQSALDGNGFTTYKDSGTVAAAGAKLRIITGGIVTFAAGDASGGAIAAGDALVASATSGRLAKAASGASALGVFGIALGSLDDGRVVVYIK